MSLLKYLKIEEMSKSETNITRNRQNKLSQNNRSKPVIYRSGRFHTKDCMRYRQQLITSIIRNFVTFLMPNTIGCLWLCYLQTQVKGRKVLSMFMLSFIFVQLIYVAAEIPENVYLTQSKDSTVP
jgi:hypothetical protein